MSGGGSSPRPRRTAWRSSPYTVAVPLRVIAEALSLRSVIPGVAGLLLGAVAGLGWAVLLGYVALLHRR